MPPASLLKDAKAQARKSKKSVESVLGMDRVVCYCAKCKGRKSHSQDTVDLHMLLNPPGPTNPNIQSAPQGSSSRNVSVLPPGLGHEPLPMDLDLPASRALSPAMSDHSMTPLGDSKPIIHDNVQYTNELAEPLFRAAHIRVYKSQASQFNQAPYNLQPAPPRDPSPALSHSHDACTMRPPTPENAIDECLFDNWPDPPSPRIPPSVPSEYDPYGSPIPATPLCNTPEPEEMAEEVDVDEHRRFFAGLYDDAHIDDGDDGDHNFGVEPDDSEGGEDVENMGEEEEMEDNDEDGLADNAQDDPENEEPPIQDLDDDENGDNDPNDELSAAFQEHPILRNIYLRTYIDLAFHHATKEQVRKTLLSHKLALEAAARVGELPHDLLEGLSKIALTVRSLERRLGMDMTRSIRIYTLCEGCGTRYSPEQIKSAQNAQCTHITGNGTCNTTLYTEVVLHDNTRKRNPIRSCPYIPLAGSVERMLLRPGIKELMQEWRQGDFNNRAHDSPPRDDQHWQHNAPAEIGDISQGRAWWTVPVGLNRSELPGGGYGDTQPEDPIALASKELGISFAINMDGYQPFKNGIYSTMGVYIVFNNLPFYLRTRIENMLLVLVIPGPKEPNSYEFNQIMEPLVDDIIAFAEGVRLNVHDNNTGQPKLERVYAHLGLGILDYMARLKVCGHAGTRSERNFCLYCTKKRCYLSVAEGFRLRGDEIRDPVDTLNNKYRWLNAPTAAAQEELRQQTGVTFTEFDRIPGWYGAINCPIDAMHLFDLGITKYLCQNILLKHGLLHPLRANQPIEDQPASRFDAFVARIQYPAFCRRKPPPFMNMTSNIKAEQWRYSAVIIPAALFEAWREGDHMPNTFIPRGGRNTKIYKFQQAQAKELLRNRKLVHRDQGGRPRDDPKPLSCVAIRNRRLIYATICRYLLARATMVKHRVTQDEVSTAQRLLRRFAQDLTRLNYPVTPNVHTALHLEAGILNYGSLYGYHTAPFERANRVLINVNNNGHTGGGVETTMARGWLKRSGCHVLVRTMQGIDNPSADDTATTNMMLNAMHDGPEHERQRGRLNAILAGEDVFETQAYIRLATTSAEVDWHKDGHKDYWELVADHCSQQLPGVVVYPYGQQPEGGVRLSNDSARSIAHVHINGIRYGTDLHRWAHSSRYAYIDVQRHPVLVKRIYWITLPVGDMNQEIVCAVVQRFQPPAHQPGFPWDEWGDHLGIGSWLFQELGAPEIIDIARFSGVFALSDITMSTGHYWLTFAMHPTEPDMLDDME